MRIVNPTTGEATGQRADQPGLVPDDHWIEDLSDPGAVGQEALRNLHALLLRATRHQVSRLSASLPGAGSTDLEDLAQQAANDAAVAVLRQLGTFEGRSRFSTWAYKFGLLHAGVAVRRQAWRHREVPLTDVLDDRTQLIDGAASAQAAVEGLDLADAVRAAIRTELTPHQRRIALALLVEGVPIDVLAERLGTNRNALYKTLHDARRRLRTALTDSGHLDSPTRSTP